MPWLRQKLMPSKERREGWLSRIQRTLDSGELFVWSWKCFRYTTKSNSCIHPDALAVPMHPGGPSRMKCDLKCTRGKTNIRGMVFPSALIEQASVTNVPLSAEVTAPTFCTTFHPTLPQSFWEFELSLSQFCPCSTHFLVQTCAFPKPCSGCQRTC